MYYLCSTNVERPLWGRSFLLYPPENQGVFPLRKEILPLMSEKLPLRKENRKPML
jgi:hypothetical protein